MRFAQLSGRAALVDEASALDVEEASRGKFDSDPVSIFARWGEFREWAEGVDVRGGVPYDVAQLGAPSPRPRQVLAVGLNYRAHSAEAGYPPDTLPSVFTKFPSCLTGAVASVELSGARVDWEVELVVVVGVGGRRIDRASAWETVAGVAVGQDISDRAVQLDGRSPQFSMGKSFAGYGPIGPALVTPDEFTDPDDLAIYADLSGTSVQSSRTSRMIYGVPELIARLSAVVELYPGDVIFTGTPEGVGNRMVPPRYLAPGDVLRSTIEGIGFLETTFTASVDARLDQEMSQHDG